MKVQKNPKKIKTQSCFGVQHNKNPEKINFINKPSLALFNLNTKNQGQKKDIISKISNKANGTLGRMDDL